MDFENFEKKFRRPPPDGELKIVTKDIKYDCNIMTIRVPLHLQDPPTDDDEELEELHFANIDRSKIGKSYSGNALLDKLYPGMTKLKVSDIPEPRADTPSPPPTRSPSPVIAPEQPQRLRSISSGNRGNSRGKRRKKEKSWSGPPISTAKTLQPTVGVSQPRRRIERTWQGPPKTMSHNPEDDISQPGRRIERTWPAPPKTTVNLNPWEPGKQPWQTTVHDPTVPVILPENVPRNTDYPERVDYFNPLHENLSFPHEYQERSEQGRPDAFCHGPSPKYNTNKGLFGDRPPAFRPSREEVINNPYPSFSIEGEMDRSVNSARVFRTSRDEVLNSSYLDVARDHGMERSGESVHIFRNSRNEALLPREELDRNAFRNEDGRNGAINKSFQSKSATLPRGNFQSRMINNNQRCFQGERSREEGYANESTGTVKMQKWNKKYNRGRGNFRARKNFI